MNQTVSAAPAGAAPGAPIPPGVTPLRHNWRFQTLWAGSTTALTGMSAADVAYPLVILAVTGSPALAGLFGFLQASALVVCSLPAGQVVDRCDRRRVLIAAESVRTATAGGVALLFAVHALALAPLLAAAVLLGAAQPFGGSARMLMVRSVVAPEQLTAALTQDEVRGGIAELAGPPLGGLLYGLARALPFLFSAASFAVSLVCALVVRPDLPRSAPGPERAPGAAALDDGGMFAGIRALWADPALRAAVVLVSFLNAAGAPLTLAAIYQLHRDAAPSWSIGLALGGAAVGGLAGAALVRPLHRRFRPGWLLLGITATEVPLNIALGLVHTPWTVAVILFGGTLGVPTLSVLLDVLIFRQVPEHQRGRTITSAMTIIGLGIPVGTGAIGLLLQYLGGAGAMFCLAGLLACGAVWAAAQPRLRAARWPAAA
ncbi:MFS transporter [Streptacidiphilus sp. PB12-B1b]|uniref:MFS transporter n=1 Tax=Streptacidiphilus sp. PB12-B1b TaxID=2705012 RepID=UPI0015F7B7F8|nr:MFS transporter [Streptacidiphilus sp. PB12-B1b]QMU75445.1 MFS transporter [Streptacidiphilus sp. PB12-B1b]